MRSRGVEIPLTCPEALRCTAWWEKRAQKLTPEEQSLGKFSAGMSLQAKRETSEATLVRHIDKKATVLDVARAPWPQTIGGMMNTCGAG